MNCGAGTCNPDNAEPLNHDVGHTLVSPKPARMRVVGFSSGAIFGNDEVQLAAASCSDPSCPELQDEETFVPLRTACKYVKTVVEQMASIKTKSLNALHEMEANFRILSHQSETAYQHEMHNIKCRARITVNQYRKQLFQSQNDFSEGTKNLSEAVAREREERRRSESKYLTLNEKHRKDLESLTGSFSQRLEEAALEEETLKSHVWEARCALESARQDYQAVREVYELFTSKLNGCLRLHQVPGVATDSASDEQLSLTSGDTVIRCLDRHLMRCEEDEIANLLQSMFRTIESTEHFSAPVISQKSDNEHGTANKHQDTVNAETQTTKDYEATLDVADVSAAPLEALTDGCSVDGPDYTEAVHVTRDDRSAIGDPETVTFGDSLTVTPQKVGCRATNHRSVADLDIDVTAVETEIPQVAALRLQLTNQTDENETLRVSLTQLRQFVDAQKNMSVNAATEETITARDLKTPPATGQSLVPSPRATAPLHSSAHPRIPRTQPTAPASSGLSEDSRDQIRQLKLQIKSLESKLESAKPDKSSVRDPEDVQRLKELEQKLKETDLSYRRQVKELEMTITKLTKSTSGDVKKSEAQMQKTTEKATKLEAELDSTNVALKTMRNTVTELTAKMQMLSMSQKNLEEAKEELCSLRIEAASLKTLNIELEANYKVPQQTGDCVFQDNNLPSCDRRKSCCARSTSMR
eukprot:GHVQ01027805.1.p1 GENE.GHVQ01027805.1~~GHVQ01027805.1.p1  ORF type:complete len:698 (+),score=71.88 GHVQ01027805.1:646-2739(+)